MITEAAELIRYLDLAPHPEGGYYREMFRDVHQDPQGRSYSTAIYYLLDRGQKSHWHRVDAVESWHWYKGAPLSLEISRDENSIETYVLGNDILSGQKPQVIVPKDAWQSAEAKDGWVLVGCVVAPAFEFDGFEMAPPDWHPKR